MKFTLYRCLVLLLAIIFLDACSTDSLSLELTAPDDGNININILAEVCTDWDADHTAVRAHMNGYTEIKNDDNDILLFTSTNNTYTISYEFVNERLRTALLTYAKESAENRDGIYSVEGYKYIGQADGASIYTNVEKNTMCAQMEKTGGDGYDYVLIGFTPIKSNLFDNFEPIIVTTLEPTNIQPMTVTLQGEFSGTESAQSVYFNVSLTPDFADAKRYKATVNGNKFVANITTSEPNVTVYYYAEILCNMAWYQSQPQSFDMPIVRLYIVGDPYPDAVNPIGVVCAVKNSGMNGTIISLDEDYLKWDVNGIFCTDYPAYNNYDGSKNNIGTSQPFGKWIAKHGTEWFGPARYQLRFSKDDIAAINAGLSSVGAPLFNGMYWSSTQRDNNTAWVVTVTETSYMGYLNQYDFYNSKDQGRDVRAMKYF